MKYYRIGRIVNTFGIRGQLKVIADTDFVEERFKEGQELAILSDGNVIQKVIISKVQLHKGTYLISFENYTNINQVEKFKGCWLAIQENEQHVLPEDEFYHHQIIGLKVITVQGKVLGTIKEILQLGSNDVWIVKRIEPKKKDALLPYIDQVVKQVDLEKKEVLVELMEGLIDDED